MRQIINRSFTEVAVGRYGIAISSILLVLFIVSLFLTTSVSAEEIRVFKSPTCGCCNKWIDHLEDNGFTVKAYNRSDMPFIKEQLGITRSQQSCHSAIVGGYVIEGHVPAADIKKLLRQSPELHGLTVPGMPVGSPGMEGLYKEQYDVLAIDKQGKTSVYNRY